MRAVFVLAACLVALCSVTAVSGGPADHDVALFSRAEFQYPELKAFFKEHVEKGQFDRVHMNYIGGKPPELIVFGPAGEEVERVNVEGKSVDDIKEMLLTYGFSEKADGKAEL